MTQLIGFPFIYLSLSGGFYGRLFDDMMTSVILYSGFDQMNFYLHFIDTVFLQISKNVPF